MTESQRLSRADAEANADAILADLHTLGYEETAARWNTSRGMIYSLAVARNARIHEARCQERATDAKLRRKDFLEEVLNATAKADVLDYLDGIPDASIELHATSIPYNVGKQYGGTGRTDKKRFHYFMGWMLSVLSEMERTLAPGGVMFLNMGATKDDFGMYRPLDTVFYSYLVEMGLTPQSRVIWEIPHGLTPKRRLAERHESILIFAKGEPAHFHPNGVRIPQREPGKRAFKGPNKGQLSGNPYGAHPTNVWRVPNVGHNNPEKTGHPAQWPVDIPRRAMLLYTRPGDLCCDVFHGSGSTQEAAIQLGRAFTGADLFYEDMRAERLAKVVPDAVSLLPGVTDESSAIWQAEARPVDVPVKKAISEAENNQLVGDLFSGLEGEQICA